MSEKPISFSTPMVKAILEGRKTVTRRAVNPQPARVEKNVTGSDVPVYSGVKTASRPYHPGDILWVRETWSALTPEHVIEGRYVYRANADAGTERVRKEYIQRGYPYQWKPAIFMPREAARLFLEVKAVRIERLQDISMKDAEAEGVEEYTLFNDFDGYEHVAVGVTTPRQSFQMLWDSLYARRVDAEKKPVCSWESNPWVWVYEFRRVEG